MNATRRRTRDVPLVHEATDLTPRERSVVLPTPPTVDESLFARAKAQWQHGDWDSLLALDLGRIEHHPERAKLALLVAAAHQQAGDVESTRRFVRLAIDWGCTRRLVSQVLVSGVYNLLGRAAAISGRRHRALEHFESAIRTADPNTDARLVGQTRSVREMLHLGMLPEVAASIGTQAGQLRHPTDAGRFGVAHQKVLDLEVDWLRERVLQLQKRLDQAQTPSPMVGRAAAEPGVAAVVPPGFHGLHGLDRKLATYVDHEGGFFVELGANDGVAQSNTLYFERERGWRGVLIEPILHKFIECRKNRASDNRFFCAACVSAGYAKPYVQLSYANLMTTPLGVDSDIADPAAHAASGRAYLPPGEDTVEVMAAARTLSSLLDEAGAPATIDLLSLDVEGGELEVLQGIDHTRHRFRWLLIESRDPERVARYLRPHGYTLADKLSAHDYLFASR